MKLIQKDTRRAWESKKEMTEMSGMTPKMTREKRGVSVKK